MKQITTYELEEMEVVNLCDGARLGCPSGLELDLKEGRVTALLVPKDCGFSVLGKREIYRIPWCHVECVGEDTILVKLPSGELGECVCRKGKRRGFLSGEHPEIQPFPPRRKQI